MKDGFVKVAAGTPVIRVADTAYNAGQIVELMHRASEQGVRVLCLPELCVTGYTCGDLFLHDTLLAGAEEAVKTILEQTKELDMLTALGVPVRYRNKLYNCAAVLCKGELLGLVPKTHLPNYGEFYERRWFVSASERGEIEYCIPFAGQESLDFSAQLVFHCAELPELEIGVELCEDLWAPEPPSGRLAAGGATLILNLSASDETVGKAEYRRALVTGQSARSVCAYVYADAGEGESTTDMVFAGHNLIAENGTILAESRFQTGLTVSEIDVARLRYERRRINTFPGGGMDLYPEYFSLTPSETELTRFVAKNPFVPPETEALAKRAETILRIQALGLKKRMEHAGAKTAVIGVSGGLDSTLALLVCARAFDLMGRPREDIFAVTMPCFGTTSRTRSNAEKLCRALGVLFFTRDITRAVARHLKDIGHDLGVRNVTYENAQARERTQVLMDIANDCGGLVVGTGDLSELALGWCTYNGDHMSMYAVNAGVPKTLVRYIVRCEAKRAGGALERVLLDVLDTPVSPELLPAEADGSIAQKTEDLVGPYELHDFFLYYFLRFGFPPRKVYRLAKYAFSGEYDGDTIKKWLRVFVRRFFSQQFKRSCVPDGPKIGSVSLSPRGDWRMPSDAVAALWIEQAEAL